MQVPEADDLWEEIQDAQDAVALRALWELMPELTREYQLRPSLKYALSHPPVVLPHMQIDQVLLAVLWAVPIEQSI